MPALWIAVLHVSPWTRQKLLQRHRIDPDDLRDLQVGVAGLRFTWHAHPERGRRAIVDLRDGRRRILVVLYPAEVPGAWRLASAYVVSRSSRWEDRRRGR